MPSSDVINSTGKDVASAQNIKSMFISDSEYKIVILDPSKVSNILNANVFLRIHKCQKILY